MKMIPKLGIEILLKPFFRSFPSCRLGTSSPSTGLIFSVGS